MLCAREWCLCVGLSGTREGTRPRRFWSRVYGVSSIGVTIARAWRRSTPIDSLCGNAPAGCDRSRSCSIASRRRVLAESVTRGGPLTARRAIAMLIPTWAAARAAAVAVVHNGVIENHGVLRRELQSQGFVFQSETDTEVVAHLIARELESGCDLFDALQRALPRLEGTYGLAVLSPKQPGVIVGARFGSPLVVGLGDGEHLLASDAMPISPHTAQVAYLQDGEVVRLTPRDFEIRHLEHGPITPRIDRIDWKPDAVELGGHAHYMIKEIREQPETVIDACRGRFEGSEATALFGGLNVMPAGCDAYGGSSSWRAERAGTLHSWAST